MEQKTPDELSVMASELESRFQEAARFRSPIGARWARSEKQYLPTGKGDSDVKQQAQLKSEYNSTNDNITRPAVKRIAARIQDMLFPANEDNWDLEPSPVPELVDPQAMGGMVNGQPVTKADLRRLEMAEAEKRCARMKAYIEDDLAECDYAASGREAIFKGCKLGPGIIYGPFTTAGKALPGFESADFKPRAACEEVDPWEMFFQPVRKLKDVEWCFRLKMMSKKDIRTLAKEGEENGFSLDQLRLLLSQEPESVTDGNKQLAESGMGKATTKYGMKRYYGPIPEKVFECLYGPDHVAELGLDDPLTQIEGEVWFCQGLIIKASLFPMERVTKLPFHVFLFEEDPESPYGFGVCDLIRDDQAARDIAWHALILNALRSAAPITAVLKGALLATQGEKIDFSFTKPRTVLINDTEIKDVKQAITEFIANNNTQALMEVYDRIGQNVDSRLMLSSFSEGDPNQDVKTRLGVMAQQSSNNVVQRQAAKAWDDGVTVPMIGQFVDWHMDNNPDEECKGDYCPIPRGATALFDRDGKVQQTIMLQQLVMADPELAAMVPKRDMFERLLSAMEYDIKLRTDEEIQQNMPEPQPDPRIVAAEMQAKSSAASDAAMIEKTKLQGQIDLQLSRERTNQEAMKLAAQTQMSEDDAEARFQMKAFDAENQKLSTLLTAEAKNREQDQKAREHATETTLKAHEIVGKQQHQQMEAARETPYRTNG